MRADLAKRDHQAAAAQKELHTLRSQVDQLHSRIQTADGALVTARNQSAHDQAALLDARTQFAQEQHTASLQVGDLQTRLAQQIGIQKALESQLHTARTHLASGPGEVHTAAIKSVAHQFEAELETQQEQHEVELEEAKENHAAQLKEYEGALKESRKRSAALEQTLTNHNVIIDQLQAGLREQANQLKATQLALEQSKQRPATHSIGTSPDADVDPTALLEGTLQKKADLIQALREELAVTHRALELAEQRLKDTCTAKEEAEAQAKSTLADALAKMQAEHGAIVDRLEKSHEESFGQLQTTLRQQIASLEATLQGKESEWSTGLEEQDKILAEVEARETEVQRQVAEIETHRKELTEREQALVERATEVDQLRAAHLAEKSHQESLWLRRQLDHEGALTAMHTNERTLEEAKEALAQERTSLRDTIEKEKEQLKKKWADLKEDRALVDSLTQSIQERSGKLAAAEATFAEKEQALQLEQQVSARHQRALDTFQAQLETTKAELDQRAEKHAAETKRLDADMKQRLAEVEASIATRERLLAETIRQRQSEQDLSLAAREQVFHEKMSHRESVCTEWEQRVHQVETRYAEEFGKMTDETSRLSAWEADLLTLQAALNAREKHLHTVETNLAEYLSPFHDESTAGASGHDTSQQALEQSFAAVASPLPKKHALTPDQRKVLASVTPILQRKLHQQPAPQAESASHHTPLPSASRVKSMSRLTPSYPSASPSAARLDSPTQAEWSMFAQDIEASFTN